MLGQTFVREILHLRRWLVLVRPLCSFIGWKPPRASVTWHEEFSRSKSAAAVNSDIHPAAESLEG